MRPSQLLSELHRIMSNDRQRWLAEATAQSLARIEQVRREHEKILAELRANPRGIVENRNADERDRDDERNGVAQ